MNQRFIELGEGFGDIYELCELMRTNRHRLYRTYIFVSKISTGFSYSLAASFSSASDNKFMPIYICREGITQKDDETKTKRILVFEAASKEVGMEPVRLEVKHSQAFAEHELYFQYVTGILRMNRLIPPLHD